MSDQVLNYADAPFSKIYREMDMLLVQFMLSVAYCDDQAPRTAMHTDSDDSDLIQQQQRRRGGYSKRMIVASYLTCLLMYRFDVSEYLSFRRVASSGLSAYLNRTTLPQLLDELLKFIINLTSELPITPDNTAAIDPSPSSSSPSSNAAVSPRIRALVRRELIQKLAGGTYKTITYDLIIIHNYLFRHTYILLSTYQSIYLSIYPSIYPIHSSIHLSINLSIHSFISIHISLLIYFCRCGDLL